MPADKGMHFKREFPSQTGYYWFITLGDPDPRIGFVQGRTLFHEGSLYHQEIDSTKRLIRIGELIETPDMETMTHD